VIRVKQTIPMTLVVADPLVARFETTGHLGRDLSPAALDNPLEAV
jgi:hypothetical protein